MEAMWMDPEVFKEWTDVGETKGNKAHLSRDQPYLTQIEMKAVAQIVVNRHWRLQLDTDMICALAEIESDRQLLVERYNKKIKESTVGIMQVLQTTAGMLFRDVVYRSYQIEGNPDLLYRPFVNIYYGAAYLKYLYGYDGKERTAEFVVQAYLGGPENVNLLETGPLWRKFRETINYYEDPRRIFVGVQYMLCRLKNYGTRELHHILELLSIYAAYNFAKSFMTSIWDLASYSRWSWKFRGIDFL
ncbi:hypothetical protein QJS10_CPA09g00856 [Acorus calamus]|uniref:Transglycosylase SLT domain-containing protein n=1 Tax=Acorus calamus TaxID=4465 RepID=A0AAV9E428_ACOCL|nr:hypothetical protein QJS10_CPA09g00856 [Acorus calamus]